MKRIYKYPISIESTTTVVLRVGAEVLKIAIQGDQDETFLWALVDPAAAEETWTFDVYGTGHDIDDAVDSISYVDTVFLSNGLVFHFFVA
jgi:hypothetical protein